DSDEMRTRAEGRDWLTRPEIAVLLAWSKITAFEDLVASDVPDDPIFSDTLKGYFPAALEPYAEARANHRLRREIIATVLSNRAVDAGGPNALMRLREIAQCDNPEAVRAIEAARRLARFDDVCAQIDKLDNQVDAALQLRLRRRAANGMFALASAIATEDSGGPLDQVVQRFRPATNALFDAALDDLSPFQVDELQSMNRIDRREGVPSDLSTTIARYVLLASAPGLSSLMERFAVSPAQAASTFFQVAGALGSDAVRVQILDSVLTAPFWDRLAARRLIAELHKLEIEAAGAALTAEGGLDGWRDAKSDALSDLRARLDDLELDHGWSFAKFSLAADAVRGFMAEG
ncbi:MAG: NAD-glutamate dehydrogenase, partial [Pseudomonadota bacterium]